MKKRWNPVLFTLIGLLAVSLTGVACIEATAEGEEEANTLSLSLTVSPSNFSESGGQATGTVSHNNPDTSSSVTVSLFTNDTTEATVFARVTIPAGANSATFGVFGVDDALLDGDQSVTISALATDYQSAAATVTVLDNEGSPPIEADAGPDQTIDCDGPDGTLVALDGRGSSDPDGDTLIYEWSVPAGVELNDPTSATPTGLFPIGITTATLTVTDGNGGLDVDDVEISVIDGTPPEVVCTTNIAALWPPDHSMRAVEIYIDATDHCSAPGELLLGAVTIRSNEPDDAEGNGDGDTIGDTDGEDGYTDSVDVTSSLTFNPETASFEGTVYLRAERHGDSYGRTYSINALVLDSANNLAESSCVVIIPHDRRKKK